MNQVQLSKILVCIDGSELSKKAGTLATGIAKKYQSKSYNKIENLEPVYQGKHISLENEIDVSDRF